MTQDEVLSALHKVVAENMNYTTWTVSTPHLVALVKLAIEHEREACAKVCEDVRDKYSSLEDPAERIAVEWCLDLIRDRRQA
jgi:hypothetical protein